MITVVLALSVVFFILLTIYYLARAVWEYLHGEVKPMVPLSLTPWQPPIGLLPEDYEWLTKMMALADLLPPPAPGPKRNLLSSVPLTPTLPPYQPALMRTDPDPFVTTRGRGGVAVRRQSRIPAAEYVVLERPWYDTVRR